LTARDGTSLGETSVNGARLKLADGAAAVEVNAQQSRLVTGMGQSLSGSAGLHLTGAREGDPGAIFTVTAAPEWVEANFVSRVDDDNRAARVDIHVEHESIEKNGLEPGEAYVSDYVPDPPAWSQGGAA